MVVVAAVVQLDSAVGRRCRVSSPESFHRDTFVFTSIGSTIIGGFLSMLRLSVSVQALLGLGWEESTGKEGELRTGGFYRYTRNPQSVGVIVAIVGGILLTNSRRVLAHGLLTIAVYILFPFVEEPWLREQYGYRYREYCERTPRFINRDSLKKLLIRQGPLERSTR